MIAEILDRRFVLAAVAQAQQDLGQQQLRGDPPVEHREDLRDLARDALVKGSAAEADAIEQVKAEQPQLRGPAEQGQSVLEEHFAYLPQDPFLSAVQSALTEYFEEVEPARIETVGAVGERRLRGAGGEAADVPAVTRRHLRMDEPPGAPARTRLFERFSYTDPRWVRSKLSEWFTKWNGPHEFRDTDRPSVTRLAGDARLILVSDWASGLERAGLVAQRIREAVEDSLSRKQDVHVIHLGDTYYSGWRREFKDNFLRLWPVLAGEEKRVGSWALNANHDMYSGGDGYYGLLDGEARFARQGGLSFFHLQNDHWDVLGLDTAYEDHDLNGSQARWVERVVDGSDRKALLLSHHQPFSARNKKGGKLRESLGRVLRPDAPAIDAWFWGHEHRHAEYEDFGGVRNGRLIGHGGVPVWMWRTESAPYRAPERWEYRERKPGSSLMPWAMFGFAILDLHGPKIDLTYVNEAGGRYRPEDSEIS
ncbi:MAG: metallophosphoesterase [Thermoleophilaceae bacterium]|nr:metallophosphoesterase [Thermoleophilaceae bacterium]